MTVQELRDLLEDHIGQGRARVPVVFFDDGDMVVVEAANLEADGGPGRVVLS